MSDYGFKEISMQYGPEDFEPAEATWDQDEWGEDEENFNTSKSDACLFPGDCLMPGDHTSDECHTAAMLEALEPDEEDKTCPECSGAGMLRGQFVECPECDGQGIKPEYW